MFRNIIILLAVAPENIVKRLVLLVRCFFREVSLENCFVYRIFFKETMDKHELLCTNIWAFTMKQLLAVESSDWLVSIIKMYMTNY